MKKIIIPFLIGISVFLSSCSEEAPSNKMSFSICADYPPFEYMVNGKYTGFDVELAKLVAAELGKEAEFSDMQFNSAMSAVQSGMVDAVISTVTVTDARKKNFDFSDSYYMESMAMIFPKDKPISDVTQFKDKKIAVQLGTSLEMWLKENAKGAEIILIDHNPQAIEGLKIGHFDGVFVDSVQAAAFIEKNPSLAYKTLAHGDSGYAIAFKKGSPLTEEVNAALKVLKESGAIKELEKRFLGAN